MEPPVEEGNRPAKNGEKPFPVSVVAEDIPSLIPAGGDMPDGTRELQSKRPTHLESIL